MKEELISFETAKLAKEKGFDIEVQNYYSGVTNKSLNAAGRIENQGKHRYDFIANWNMEGIDFISAPTQFLLQKWLVHKTDITVITDWIKGQRFYYVGLSYINSKNEIDIWFSHGVSGLKVKYESHEQALEAGLQEALKLIP